MAGFRAPVAAVPMVKVATGETVGAYVFCDDDSVWTYNLSTHTWMPGRTPLPGSIAEFDARPPAPDGDVGHAITE